MTVPDLIARWRSKDLSGAALMRGLVGYEAWEVPVSEAAARVALAEHALPCMQLSTARDGKACLLLYSSPAAYLVYQKQMAVPVAQHFVKLSGRMLFGVPMEGVDQIWVDPLSPHDVYYDAEQFARLREVAEAIAVEAALTGLRRGNPPEGALQRVRTYATYCIGVAEVDGTQRLLLAPDAQGRTLGAVFTTDDAFDAFRPDADAQARGGSVKQMQMNGMALFGTLRRMQLDGFVFNCAGPVPPVAFAHAMAGVVLDG